MASNPYFPAIAAVILLLLAGCGGGVDTTPTQANTPVSTPTSTESPTSTSTPTPSPTSTPTPSPTPSPTPTATATPAQTPRGPQHGTEWTVTITRVIDGDTVEAKFPNGEIDTLRLLGIDTPETTYSRVSPDEFEGIPSTTAGKDHLFNWGEKASDFTRNRLDGKTVRIEVDPEADRRGSFGRLLVHIYVDGENFNKQLISEGYARMYDSSFSKRGEFKEAETTAQENEAGLWNFEAPTPTPTPTPSGSGEGSLAVAQIHADADGNDHENENDEYVVFENTGGGSLDMTGWTVRDEAGHTYSFPDSFTLESGQEVTLYTGSGTDTETELYWGSDSAIWNNGGDTIIVENEDGDVVLEESY